MKKEIIPIDFITQLPTPERLKELWEQPIYQIKKALSPEIEYHRDLCLKAGAQYRASNGKQEYWNLFEYHKAKCAGLSSGMKKKIYQTKKITYIGEILRMNKIKEQHAVNYTLIQFIAQQIDGKKLDKETCLDLRLHYKGNKQIYTITDELKPFWHMVPIVFGLEPKTKNALRTITKINKI